MVARLPKAELPELDSDQAVNRALRMKGLERLRVEGEGETIPGSRFQSSL